LTGLGSGGDDETDEEVDAADETDEVAGPSSGVSAGRTFRRRFVSFWHSFCAAFDVWSSPPAS
jgi:hypothetical protein